MFLQYYLCYAIYNYIICWQPSFHFVSITNHILIFPQGAKWNYIRPVFEQNETTSDLYLSKMRLHQTCIWTRIQTLLNFSLFLFWDNDNPLPVGHTYSPEQRLQRWKWSWNRKFLFRSRSGTTYNDYMWFLWLDAFCLRDIIGYNTVKKYIKYLISSFNSYTKL